MKQTELSCPVNTSDTEGWNLPNTAFRNLEQSAHHTETSRREAGMGANTRSCYCVNKTPCADRAYLRGYRHSRDPRGSIGREGILLHPTETKSWGLAQKEKKKKKDAD